MTRLNTEADLMLQFCNTDPDSDLGQICPGSNALPSDGVWVAFAVLECGLELPQLNTGEVTALATSTATL